MQKDGSDENKNYKFRNIAPENYSSKSKNVDINKLYESTTAMLEKGGQQ